MQAFFEWFTHMEHTKPLALVLNFIVFVGILAYLFVGKQRSERIENQKYLPLDDDDSNN
jgi:cbb3-type cytochrome oxidase subunit 3